MAVFTSDSQGGADVDQRDFFLDAIATAKGEVQQDALRRMVALIDRIDAEFPDTKIWLLTSHYRLVLMDSPTYDSGEWLVVIEQILDEEYYFSYRLTDPPFPGARVHGVARGIDEAMRLIKVAMKESGGWRRSIELGFGS